MLCCPSTIFPKTFDISLHTLFLLKLKANESSGWVAEPKPVAVGNADAESTIEQSFEETNFIVQNSEDDGAQFAVLGAVTAVAVK